MPRSALVLSLLLGCLCGLPSSAQSLPDRFLLLDDIGQEGKPDLGRLGITAVRAIPTVHLWSPGASRDEPDVKQIQSAVTRYANKLGLVCLNIEHWKTNEEDPVTLRQNIQRLIVAAEAAKAVSQESLVGYYSLAPVREYLAPVRHDRVALEKWRAQNERLKDLAEVVDVIFPSLYAFNHNAADWEVYARANIEEARKYGKPVIAFIWPQIHQSSRSNGLEFVNKQFWRKQLETVHSLADGAIIWTPWGTAMRTTFDDNAPWWQATLEFLVELEREGVN